MSQRGQQSTQETRLCYIIKACSAFYGPPNPFFGRLFHNSGPSYTLCTSSVLVYLSLCTRSTCGLTGHGRRSPGMKLRTVAIAPPWSHKVQTCSKSPPYASPQHPSLSHNCIMDPPPSHPSAES